MTVSPLSLTELYVWWSSNTIVGLTALGIALYATWRAQRTNRKLRELIRWAQGVDPLIGDAEVEPVDEPPTAPQEAVIDEGIERLEQHAQRPTPFKRVDPAEEAWRERFGLRTEDVS